MIVSLNGVEVSSELYVRIVSRFSTINPVMSPVVIRLLTRSGQRAYIFVFVYRIRITVNKAPKSMSVHLCMHKVAKSSELEKLGIIGGVLPPEPAAAAAEPA